jgi:histidine triad (HIT) family protein
MAEQNPAEQCIFCKIAKGEIPSFKIYEDEKCLAFLDINPATKGHVLLIPKDHYHLMPLIPEELSAHLGQIAKLISLKSIQLLGASHSNIFVGNGAAAGQNAPHVIIHVIPRYEGDGLNLELNKHSVKPEEISKVRELIGKGIEKEFDFKLPVCKKEEAPIPKEEPSPKEESKKEPSEEPKKEEKASLDDVANFLTGQ